MTCCIAVVGGPTAATASGAPAPQPAVTVQLDRAAVAYGDRIVATGRITPAAAGRSVTLEQRSGSGWVPLASGTTSAAGRYRMVAKARRSGALRVRLAPTAAVADVGAVAVAPAISSALHPLRVAARLHVDRARTPVRIGRLLEVRGHVAPARAGRLVLLQRRLRGHWRTLAHVHTRARGAFTLRLRARASFRSALRVRSVGTSTLAAGSRAAGVAAVLRPTVASWYGSGHFLACGGVITGGTMGVAHKTLPCGTLVTIRYRGRQIRVPVVDRGPFIGGREFDLAPGARNALGFDGVGTIWVAS
jgi:hypothetical protein